MTGEPDTFMRPQSAIVETGDFGQGVEAAAMSVASEIVKLLQLPKDSEIGIGAENAFQLGKIGDLVTAEMSAQGGWIEGSGSHNVRVHTPYVE